MRIAAGVLLLIVSLWSMIGGGCIACVGQVGDKVGKMGAAGFEKVAEAVATDDPEMQKQLAEAKAKARQDGEKEKFFRTAKMISVVGMVDLLGGVLCLVAGILFFVNTGRALGFIAPLIGIVGEVLWFAVVGFEDGTGIAVGVSKIVILVFCLIAARSVGQRPPEPAVAA